MGLLRDPDGKLLPLRATTTLGRSVAAGVRIPVAVVSGQHALIRWTDAGWEIRDLGSRNGTALDGRRLVPGEGALLAVGTRVELAHPDPIVLVVESVDPPGLVATRARDGLVVFARGGHLALPPDADVPEVELFADGRGDWVQERSGERAPAGEAIDVAGERWVLDLPGEVPMTRDAAPPTLAESTLAFVVSRDEEHASLQVRHAARVVDLEARVHHYLLLTLARVRLADQAARPGEDDGHGWIEVATLARKLRIDDRLVNLQVFRARQQLAEAGFDDAALVVERRPPGQVRIGVPALTVSVA